MGSQPRRILFVTGYFPPRAPIGAVRTGKLAEHWLKLGHDVRVICINATPGLAAKPEQSGAQVHYLPYQEPGQFVTSIKSTLMRSNILRGLLRPKPSGSDAKTEAPRQLDAAALNTHTWQDIYHQFLLFPDSYKSWIKPAVRLALSWKDEWKPDLIYSSGPPHSGQIVSAQLAARLAVPWIAEFRDLWVGDPYFDRHPFVNWQHERLAAKTLAKATACVVVTKSAAETLKRFTRLPIVISYNGFDPEDFAGLETVQPLDRGKLTIIHAGVIYLGRRDPTPLFKAMASIPEAQRNIRCLFYHDSHGSVAGLAAYYGLQACVEIRDAIPRKDILRIEREADILLECRWQDASGDGVIPGKLFEYIGARRPILSIGSLTGEAAAIVRDNGFGLASNDPDEIKAMLVNALETKAKLGRLPDVTSGDRDRFRREIQFEKIDQLFQEILASKAATQRH